jgi:hypothetical protein
MTTPQKSNLPDVHETGPLGVFHLKRYWTRPINARRGISGANERARDKTLLFGLGVGLHETMVFLIQRDPSYEEFEGWILRHNGGALAPAHVARLNSALCAPQLFSSREQNCNCCLT